MHIKRLHIDSFKCLQDFDINFDTDNGGSAAILIGENGTGKSSMMEMIIRIFMSIYSLQYNTSRSRTRIITGNYEIEYTYASKTIKIQMQNIFKRFSTGFISAIARLMRRTAPCKCLILSFWESLLTISGSTTLIYFLTRLKSDISLSL